MRRSARNIWDTRIQGVCAAITARSKLGVEVYHSGCVAQVSISPPRIAINPNRVYPIEQAIKQTGRFAINVMGTGDLARALELVNIRRREPNKAQTLNMEIREDERSIPYLPGVLKTVFCEVESVLNAGDHTLFIARVLESRENAERAGEKVLLYSELLKASSALPSLVKFAQYLLVSSGTLQLIEKLLGKQKTENQVCIARNTYEDGGQTEAEIEAISRYGFLDQSRHLEPPPAPGILRKQMGVCVVGTGWGSFHCDLLRRASSHVRLFVCGRNPEKTAQLARRVGAADFFIGMEAAIADSRVQALTLALPHDLHRPAAEMAATAGKHVLVEKPIATNLGDADAMIESARRAGTILMVAEDMHFRPAVGEAVRKIRRGEIGEPLYLMAHGGGVQRRTGWPAEKERMGGGVLIDIGVHYIRGLRLLLGEPTSIFASRAMQINTKMSGEDSIQALFSSDAGWEAHILLSWASKRGNLPDIVVAGEKGTLHLWPGAGYLNYYPVAPRSLTRVISYVRPYWLQAKLMRPNRQCIRIALSDEDKTGYLSEVREFLDAIAKEREPCTLPEDGRRDLEIVLCGYEALERDERVQIKPLHSKATIN
ncbi:MAG: Gfo/Idh/MocA family oxidoreductase [Candidatus Binatia bacterium]